MRRQAGDPMKGRVHLDALIKYANTIPEARTIDLREAVEKRSKEMGERFRSCTVSGFYEGFILERVPDMDAFDFEQEWMDDCIKVALGVDCVSELTMNDLASKIAEKMQQDDLSDEDRWVLYELCFFLTAQMARVDEQYFSSKQQCVRLGTPDEKEPHSLYRRVNFYRKRAKAHAALGGPKVRIRLDELLGSVRDAHVLGENTRLSIPELKIGPVLDCLLIAKYDLNKHDKRDEIDLFKNWARFAEMFEMYTGLAWSPSNTITEIANQMTWMFWLNVKGLDADGIDRANVLQAYELCYEFINAFASEEYDEGHTSLMVREGLDSKYDVDERAKAEAKDSIA